MTTSAHPRLPWERVFWIALVAVLGWRMWPQAAAAFGVGSASTVAPSFQVTTLEGATISDRELRGKVVLLNFWATWCPPCRVEMPGFEQVYERHRAEGFVVLGVATDAGGSEVVKRFLGERGITYPVAMAPPGMAASFGGVRLLPTSFLIDRGGRIRHQVGGMFTSVALEQAVQRLLDEPAAAAGAPSGGTAR